MSRVSYLFLLLLVSVLAANASCVPRPRASSSQTVSEECWILFDRVTPDLESVEWVEEGKYAVPNSRVAEGKWFSAWSEQFLVKSGYVFASFHESFNFTAVNMSVAADGRGKPYGSFDEFRNETVSNPRWWMEYSWGIDIAGLAVSADKTQIGVEMDADNSTAGVSVSLALENIPGYFMSYVLIRSSAFRGLSFSDVSFGNMEDLKWFESHDINGSYYKISLKTPAKVMTKSLDTYSCSLWTEPQLVGTPSDSERTMMISMPSDTEVKTVAPLNRSTYSQNNAVFNLQAGDPFPDGFHATSGPPSKSLTQLLVENVGAWATSPTIWAAFGTLAVLLFTGLQGRRLWNRRKTYYRLYKTMITLYDRYGKEAETFRKEMEDLSKAVTKYFVEDKITDEQLDKLLARRDDLLKRAGSSAF